MFPNSIILKPGVNGPKPSLYWSTDEKLIVDIVLPAKLLVHVIISAEFSSIPLIVYPHFLAALRAVSTPSAPEFMGSTQE